MRVRVRLFAGTRDAVGASHLDLDLDAEATVGDAFSKICAAHPRLAAYAPHALFALDGAFVAEGAPLRDGAEVAVMPPVSGGDGRIVLSEAPFSLDALTRALVTDGAGAVVAFTGFVRDHADGHVVSHLHFEAYESLALTEMTRLREQAVSKFNLTDLTIYHRLGTMPVGEPIVAVVAAAPHRAAAFEATQWVMHELKQSVPIWKREEGPALDRWVRDPTGV